MAFEKKHAMFEHQAEKSRENSQTLFGRLVPFPEIPGFKWNICIVLLDKMSPFYDILFFCILPNVLQFHILTPVFLEVVAYIFSSLFFFFFK